ncbi:MAG TPA: hypothetical protein VMS75_09220 [Terriglobales bacterium]|nr:hypothetical protein [Terriglobales bacterium]
MRARWGLIMIMAASSAMFGQNVDKAGLVRIQRQITAESELAKEPKFYFILDIREKKLELKVRGMALRSWKLGEMRFWGKPAFSGTVQLVRKSALKKPQRNVIKPGETATAAKDPAKFELEALELKDMPKSFGLEFGNGLRVSVKAMEHGLKAFSEDIGWYIALPVENYISAREGKQVSVLELRFADEKDAQAIYWTFFEGIKGLIH